MSTTAFPLGTPNILIQEGQIIGASGNTGWSTAPHLHFEVRNGSGVSIDPSQNGGLWKDGQWANPSRPIPAPHSGGEITVEDSPINANGFSKGGGGIPNNSCAGNCQSWTRTPSDYMYYTAADRGTNPHDQWARWQPSLPTYGGIYEILVHVPNQYATTWQAPYVIVHNDGTSYAVIDQYGLNNQWVSIGSYVMTNGNYVYTHDATGEASTQRSLGVDAVKFVRRGTTYAPDIKQGNGWSHSISIRSNGGDAVITANGFKADGTLACSGHFTIPAHGSLPIFCPSTDVASLVVDARQDVSVVVLNRHNGAQPQAGETRITDYNGIASSGGLDVGWNQTGTTLWVPSLKRSLYGRTGQVYLLNTGAVATDVSVTLWEVDTGAPGTCTAITALAPGARIIWTPSQCGGTYDDKLYGARFTSIANQPLAAVVVETNHDGGGGIATTNAFSSGATPNYAPVVKHNFYGHSATVVVQNISSSTGSVTATYYDRDRSVVYPQPPSSVSVPAGRSRIFTLANAGVLTDTIASAHMAGPTLITTMYENRANSNWRMQSNGFTRGSQTVVLPRLYKANADAVGLSWTSGFQVQNVGSGDATIQVQYYDMSGYLQTATHTPVPPWGVPIPPNKSVTYNLAQSTLPTNFTGSAVITSNQPIVVTVNATASGETTIDAAMSYNGVNR